MSEIRFDVLISLGITLVTTLIGLVGLYYQLRERFTDGTNAVKSRVDILETKFEERRREDDRRYEQIAEMLGELRRRPRSS